MATRRPVVLNEDDTRLETPQTGDDVQFDEYTEFESGVTIQDDYSSTWAGPSLPIYTKTQALVPMTGTIPSYQEYLGYYAQGTTTMDAYVGGYITGVGADIEYRTTVADPGYTTIRGMRAQVNRRDRQDSANVNGLWLFGGTFGIDMDANNSVGSGVGKSINIVTNNKLEGGYAGNVSHITCQTLLATSNGFVPSVTGHRNFDGDEVCLSIDSGTIQFGNTQPTNNYVNIANLYHLRLRTITARTDNVTIGNHFGIWQEQANCENVFEGTMTCNNAVVNMPNLPTTDPTVAGQLWNDSGTLKVSAG